MPWAELPDRERAHRIDKPYIMFTERQIIFGAKFLKNPNNIVFALHGNNIEPIYVNAYVDEINKKIGFDFTIEATDKNSRLRFHKYGWTGYISNYRFLKNYPFIEKIISAKYRHKYIPTLENDLWIINLEDYLT